MRQLLNTLYVTTDGAYVRQDHESVRVEIDGQTKLDVPSHHLGAIVCFGNVLVSPGLIQRCATEGRALTFLDRGGRFVGRVQGPVAGNVLLRIAQYKASEQAETALALARGFVAGKLQNARQVVMRSAREADDPGDGLTLKDAAQVLAHAIMRLEQVQDLDELRGVEGSAARAYFAAFSQMIRVDRSAFAMDGRSRRPPQDRINALLSFLYTLITSDCVSAAEGVGLDPQVGFLHTLRPGRPALALDLVEELRPVLGDRLALTLINLRRIQPSDFEVRAGGAVLLSDSGRKTVLQAYQQRKQDEVYHPVLDTQVPLGLVPHMQARLLARSLRGEMEAYIPFLYR